MVKNIGTRPLEFQKHEDTMQDFESLLGFPCEGLVRAWEWKDKDIFITEAFLGKSESFLKVIDETRKLKGKNAAILILGETGSGKELLAHFIHLQEGNAGRPFEAMNCGAIPDNLMESELFGHEKGSFTGAVESRAGCFERANGGDIFLDEIGTLKPDLQVKLLRVLQDKQVSRIGGKKKMQLDFRVIAASNEDLERKVKEGQFRLDLFHRLSTFTLTLPPLRERLEDIPFLVDYFIHRYNPSKNEMMLTEEALDLLSKYDWPGNIRELENLIYRVVVMTEKSAIDEKEIFKVFGKRAENKEEPEVKREDSLKVHVGFSEKKKILDVLEKEHWNFSKAARTLKISRVTLYKKVKQYGLSK